MNLGINNTAFKGKIRFYDAKENIQEVDTKNIREIGVTEDGNLFIKSEKVKYSHFSDSPKNSEETHNIEAYHLEEDYDRLMKIYDIASRNNVTIEYLDSHNPLNNVPSIPC